MWFNIFATILVIVALVQILDLFRRKRCYLNMIKSKTGIYYFYGNLFLLNSIAVSMILLIVGAYVKMVFK